MAVINVQIKNLPQIRAAFAKAPSLMVKNLNAAIAKAMFAIQAETELNVGGGRGINVITGRLHSSTLFPPKLSNLKGVYGDDFVDYAVYVHEGTSKMRARPFLLNAVNTKERSVDDYFKQAVQDTLDTIAKESG